MFAIAGCRGGEQSETQSDGFITVDVTANYPKKELILQDFMDVEYIALETNDDFITQGLVQDIGRDIIIVTNRNDDGDIFTFDRNGKALKKINRKGQGAEEYTDVLGIALDEDNGEMFVNDYLARKILVYDLDGNFKRRLQHKEGLMYDKIYNFDRENLICHDGLNDNSTSLSLINVGQSFLIISKQDGSITKEIQIPFKEKKSKVIKFKDEVDGLTYAYAPSTDHSLVPYLDNWILVELSADTMYNYSPDHYQMEPLITRTPSVQSMDPEVFLFISLLTDRYYFMEKVTKDVSQGEFPGTDLLYDKQKNAIFRYIVYNGDYSNKEQAYLKSVPVNTKIPSRQILETPQLVEDYKNGRLKGRLKEIASELDEEDNPVIMLIKHKN